MLTVAAARHAVRAEIERRRLAGDTRPVTEADLLRLIRRDARGVPSRNDLSTIRFALREFPSAEDDKP